MNLQVGVKVFLKNKEGKFLLLKRSPDAYPDVIEKWDIVGGRIESGTPLLENLKREIAEETQLTLSTAPILIGAQDIIRGNDRHVVRLSYVGETEGEPVLNPNEHTEFAWFTLSELRDLKELDAYAKEFIDQHIL